MENSPRYSGFGNDILRIELRTPVPPNGMTMKCTNCGHTETLLDIVNQNHNTGVKVAYFLEIRFKSLGKVLREAVDIIKLIYRGHYKK